MDQSLETGDKTRKAKPPLVPSVERAIHILKILNKDSTERGISEIARMLDAHKGTIREILLTLEHYGLVERNDDTKKYRLGRATLEFGRTAMRNHDIRQIARPFMARLTELTSATSLLTILDGDSTIAIECTIPDDDWRISVPIGRRLPAIAGSVGKLLLAYLDDKKELEKIFTRTPLFPFTNRSITNEEDFKAELRTVRQKGYAIDNQEYKKGMSGVSAPVRDHHGRVVAALSVIGLGITDEMMAEIIKQTVKAARQISLEYGYDG
jgi:IclR family KDG regulon transcriptional repressor